MILEVGMQLALTDSRSDVKRPTKLWSGIFMYDMCNMMVIIDIYSLC